MKKKLTVVPFEMGWFYYYNGDFIGELWYDGFKSLSYKKNYLLFF